MIIYGIDPGVTGAIAVTVNGQLHDVADIPVRIEGTGTVKRKIDAAALASIVRDWRRAIGIDSEMAIIERVASMPKQGVASVFSLGHSAGACEAVMLALGVRVDLIAPRTWKLACGVAAEKSTSSAKASLLFPAHAGKWSRKLDHNRAEAVMLAWHGWTRHA